MIVILATINGPADLSASEAATLREFCISKGIGKPVQVSTAEELNEALEKNSSEGYLLFSNFPPDSSYPGSGKSISIKTKNGVEESSWEADSYTKSSALFGKICKKHHIKGLHFITAAPENVISDENLKSISPTTLISVQRKKDWIQPEYDFHALYRLYVTKKIKETISEN